MQLLCMGVVRAWRLLQARKYDGAHRQALHGSHQMRTDCMCSRSSAPLRLCEDSQRQMRWHALSGKATFHWTIRAISVHFPRSGIDLQLQYDRTVIGTTMLRTSSYNATRPSHKALSCSGW